MNDSLEGKFKAFAREFLKHAPDLAKCLVTYIKSKETDWTRAASDIGGDGLMFDLGESHGISTLASMMAFFGQMMTTANTAQLKLNARAVSLLCKFAYIICNSTLFLRAVNRLKEKSDKEVALSCYETLRNMAMYYEGARILYEWVETESYHSNVHLFSFAGKDPVNEDDVKRICANNSFNFVSYDHSITPEKLDYLTLIRSRANEAGYTVHPGRHAFTTQYPNLYDWTTINEGTAYSHAEVSLALNVLLDGNMTGDLFFGVSKQCCFLCESLLERLNDVHDATHLIIPQSHKKVYLAWKLSGIKEVDGKVIEDVWEKFDELVTSVKYQQPSDTLIPIPLADIVDIPLEDIEMKKFVESSKHFSHEDW